jgi:hypothetical protein
MRETDKERRARAEKSLQEGSMHSFIGIMLGARGYGRKKSNVSGKPTPDSKTIHDIRADFVNPVAKSQLIFCKECGVKTRHTTPFAGYPFQCVVNHNGTTKCDGCGYDVDFIARVVVTGQHEHRSYCVSCDEIRVRDT